MARRAALSSLRLQAAHQAEIQLARNEWVRKILSDEFADRDLSAELPALAALALRASSEPVEELVGLPPVLRLELTGTFTLLRDEELGNIAPFLLENPLMVENSALAAMLERQYLAAYDEAAAEAMQSTAMPPESAPFSPGRPPAPSPEQLAELQKSHAALLGIQEYVAILPDLHRQDKLSPALLPRLLTVARHLPENYLIRSELGRLYLWLEDSEKALASLNAAIALNPDFAQAYNHRGTLWLIRHKPSLALADLNRAIELAPERAEYFYNRAVAWKTMGDAPAMCGDLKNACLLGQCDALEWASANGECR